MNSNGPAPASSPAEIEELRQAIEDVKRAAIRSDVSWLRGFVLGRLVRYDPKVNS